VWDENTWTCILAGLPYCITAVAGKCTVCETGFTANAQGKCILNNCAVPNVFNGWECDRCKEEPGMF